MNKCITITIKMDSEFVRMLNTTVALRGLREKDELTAADQLALTALAEARGGTEAEVWVTILPTWRPHLDVVSSARKVEVTGE